MRTVTTRQRQMHPCLSRKENETLLKIFPKELVIGMRSEENDSDNPKDRNIRARGVLTKYQFWKSLDRASDSVTKEMT